MRAAALILACMFATNAAVTEERADTMLKGCKIALTTRSPKTGIDMAAGGRCLGIAETLLQLGPFLKDGARFCPPDAVTIGQVLAVIVQYGDARPERHHESFFILAHESLLSAWRCK